MLSFEKTRRAIDALAAHLAEQRRLHRWPRIAERQAVKRGRSFTSMHTERTAKRRAPQLPDWDSEAHIQELQAAIDGSRPIKVRSINECFIDRIITKALDAAIRTP
jgi:hypothetical protein